VKKKYTILCVMIFVFYMLLVDILSFHGCIMKDIYQVSNPKVLFASKHRLAWTNWQRRERKYENQCKNK